MEGQAKRPGASEEVQETRNLRSQEPGGERAREGEDSEGEYGGGLARRQMQAGGGREQCNQRPAQPPNVPRPSSLVMLAPRALGCPINCCNRVLEETPQSAQDASLFEDFGVLTHQIEDLHTGNSQCVPDDLLK